MDGIGAAIIHLKKIYFSMNTEHQYFLQTAPSKGISRFYSQNNISNQFQCST